MKVGTRIAAGSGLLVALLAGVLAYHLVLMQGTARTSRSAKHKVEALTLLLTLERRLTNFTEFREKLRATGGDPVYWEKLQVLQTSVEEELAHLRQMGLGDPHVGRLEKLATEWENLFAAVALQMPPVPVGELDKETLGYPSEQEARIARRVAGLSRSLEEAIREDLTEPEVAGDAARRVSWGVVGFALALCGLVTLVTVRSIMRPLGELAQAMQAVESGQLDTRLELDRKDELSSLAASFNAMSQRLSELDRMKKEFVAHVSHELKNPLVAMHETNQLLVDQLAGPLTDQQRRLLELNIESGKRLSSMLSNLLDVSSFEAGAMTYELKPVDVAGLARLAVQEFEARARDRGLALCLTVAGPPLPILVPADRDRVLQVLENLLDNAIKLSPPGGAIEVSVHPPATPVPAATSLLAALRREPRLRNGVLITVADRGPGVPDEHKEAIFRKFHQVSHKPRTHGGGVGLGLAICREIVAAHEGAIWVADRPGGGSVFSVLLPAGGDALPKSLPAPVAHAQGARA